MIQYINKVALVAEIKRKIHNIDYEGLSDRNIGQKQSLYHILSFLNTLEVKDVEEHDDVDLDIICEEMGVKPDSRIASMFKNAFYKAVDKFLDKKENKV